MVDMSTPPYSRFNAILHSYLSSYYSIITSTFSCVHWSICCFSRKNCSKCEFISSTVLGTSSFLPHVHIYTHIKILKTAATKTDCFFLHFCWWWFLFLILNIRIWMWVQKFNFFIYTFGFNYNVWPRLKVKKLV